MKELRIAKNGLMLKIREDKFSLTFKNDFFEFEIYSVISITQNLSQYFLNGCSFYLAIPKNFDKGLLICNDEFEIRIDLIKEEKRNLSNFFEEIKDEIENEDSAEI